MSAKDEDDVAFLVLAAFAGHWEMNAYPTSRVIRANCGHLAWLSPPGEAMLDTAYTICLICHDATVHVSQEPHRAAPGAWEHLEELHGAEAIKWARREMRRRGIRDDR